MDGYIRDRTSVFHCSCGDDQRAVGIPLADVLRESTTVPESYYLDPHTGNFVPAAFIIAACSHREPGGGMPGSIAAEGMLT